MVHLQNLHDRRHWGRLLEGLAKRGRHARREEKPPRIHSLMVWLCACAKWCQRQENLSFAFCCSPLSTEVQILLDEVYNWICDNLWMHLLCTLQSQAVVSSLAPCARPTTATPPWGGWWTECWLKPDSKVFFICFSFSPDLSLIFGERGKREYLGVNLSKQRWEQIKRVEACVRNARS